MNPIQKIKGFADIFSPRSDSYTALEEKARDIFTRYGFTELRIPLVEKTELFARSIGAETDIVQKEMFTFPDRKGRSLSLRPEATAGVARAYIENKIYSLQDVSKLYTLGPMFRYERPQKGRQRQFQQINAEILGSTAPETDAELLLMLTDFLQEAGFKKLHLELNSLGCPQCRPHFLEAVSGFLAGRPEQALCPDCRRRSQTNPLRVYDCKIDSCRELIQNGPVLTEYLCPDCQEHFHIVKRLLERADVSYRINPNLVRGLDYYQRTTFEVLSEDIGAQSAVAGGGRYDGLLKDLGGPDLPGIGFACGMERLLMILGDVPQPGSDFFLAPLTPPAREQGLLLACQLRAHGLCGDVAFEGKSLKSQLRQANKQQAAVCLILGETELARSTVLLKDMASGAQTEIRQEDLLEAVLQGKT
ncbi:MAG: histidine--tRNA ligase [Desulfohalobiaceae bacterium]|nr:histidine--tRNA ligase [Desulfohalobiaceae bacterium]